MVKFITRCTNTLFELWIWLFATLAFAALLFSWFEGVDYWKAFYWACVTATSTGYGDISPKTVPGQILSIVLMFMALFFILPLMIARVINSLVENHDAWTHDEQVQLMQDVSEIKAMLNKDKEKRSGRTKALPFSIMSRVDLAAALWYITGRNVHGGSFDKTAPENASRALEDTYKLADDLIGQIDAAKVR